MRTPEELTDLFRARGLKVTPQRVCIFGLLDGHLGHPTAEAIYAEAREVMPTISLRTVYQTLNDLASMGEIQALDLGTGSGRFDPNVDQHHHLVCVECGVVRDVYVDEAPSPKPRALGGFDVTSTEIVFRGRCEACASGATRSVTSTTATTPTKETKAHA